jgi:hypothetical protein
VEVHVASPLDGCSQLDAFLEQVSYPIYFLVQGREGACTYSRKVHWARKTLARGLIIIDSEKGTNNLIWRKNDNFHTFLMPEAEGDDLLQKLGAERSFIAQLNINSQTDKNFSKKAMEVWISSLNRGTLCPS